MLPIDKKIEIVILKSIISFNTHTQFFSHLSKCISKSNKAVRIDYQQDRCKSETEKFLKSLQLLSTGLSNIQFFLS